MWMKQMATVVLTFLLLCKPAICQEGVNNADRVVPGCRAFVLASQGGPSLKDYGEEVHWTSGVCMGEIMAIADFAKAAKSVCPPANLQYGQLLAMVTSGLDADPTRWHENLTLLALEILAKNFPCH
jgi:hypothetical protein